MSDSPMNDAVLAGVPRLLDDLQKLLETHDHADILFLVGREETPFYAHRLLLNIRYCHLILSRICSSIGLVNVCLIFFIDANQLHFSKDLSRPVQPRKLSGCPTTKLTVFELR